MFSNVVAKLPFCLNSCHKTRTSTYHHVTWHAHICYSTLRRSWDIWNTCRVFHQYAWTYADADFQQFWSFYRKFHIDAPVHQNAVFPRELLGGNLLSQLINCRYQRMCTESLSSRLNLWKLCWQLHVWLPARIFGRALWSIRYVKNCVNQIVWACTHIDLIENRYIC